MNTQLAHDIIKKNEESYNTIARFFSQTRGYTWPEIEDYASLLKDGQTIVDIGCGNGRMSTLFNLDTVNYIGVDSSVGLLKEAQKLYPRAKFQKGNILDFPDISQKISMIWCIAVLNHIPSRELQIEALKGLYDNLDRGGYLVLTNWNLWQLRLNKKSLFSFLKDRLLLRSKRFEQKYHVSKKGLGVKDVITVWRSNDVEAPLYYYAFTRPELIMLCKKVGFNVKEAFYSKGSRFKGGNIVLLCQRD